MLPHDVLVAATADGFLLHAPSATVKVDLDIGAGRHEPDAVASAARLGPDGLERAGLITAEEAEALRGLLAERLIGTVECFKSAMPQGVSTLFESAVDYARTGGVPSGVLVVTALEALWLPPGAAASSARWALRMFVSRLADQTRLAVYGTLIAGKTDLSVQGDLPDSDVLDALAGKVASPDGISSWSLSPLAETGRLRDFPARLDDANGRLAIAQVTGVDEWALDDGSTIFHAMGRSAEPNLAATDLFAEQPLKIGCSGTSTDPAFARRKCIIEGVERFAMGDIPPGILRRVAATELTGAWLQPHEIISYDPAHRVRLGLREFDVDSPEWWVAGQRAGEPVWVPAALVFCPFPDVPAWLHRGYVTTNAAAAHTEPEQAVTRAWLEGVERDAFQRGRAAERPPPMLDPRTLPPALGPLVRFLGAQADLSVAVLPGVEGIPVFAAIAVNDNGLALGMSAAEDLETAARKALIEACAEVRFPFPDPPAPEAVEGPVDHGGLYREAANIKRLHWLWAGPVVDWESIRPVRVRLPERAVTYLFPSRAQADLTVVKVLDPGLVPLTFGYDADPTGCRAFAEGYLRRGAGFSRPLFPHPFA